MNSVENCNLKCCVYSLILSFTRLLVPNHLGYSFQFLDFHLNQVHSSTFPFLSTFPSIHSMSNYEENMGLAVPETVNNDPVIKAVFDNVMGNIPKKPKVTVFCSVCNLEFSSQIVLDTHLSGSKHQRKLKSKELLKSLEATETSFERNSVSGVIRCTICDVTVNSPQLLATHVAGNKHKSKKSKRENDDDGGMPTKKLCTTGTTEQTNGDSGLTPAGSQASGGTPNASSGSSTGGQRPRKKERPPLDITIPHCVTKLEDTKTGGKFLCNPCQAHCNSDIQLSQHLSSKKHLDKVSGKKTANAVGVVGGGTSGRGWKGGPYGRGGRGSSNRGGVSNYKWDTKSSSTKWEGLSAIPTYSSGSYSQTTFPETNLSSSYPTDATYSLTSLSRALPTNYGRTAFSRSSASGRLSTGGGRGVGKNRAGGRPYTRADTYNRSTGSYRVPLAVSASDYGRTSSVDAIYSRATDYGAEFALGRSEDLAPAAYSREATDYVAASAYGAPEYDHSYGSSQGLSHANGRGLPFTYTQPLSQNFVSGGSIL